MFYFGIFDVKDLIDEKWQIVVWDNGKRTYHEEGAHFVIRPNYRKGSKERREYPRDEHGRPIAFKQPGKARGMAGKKYHRKPVSREVTEQYQAAFAALKPE